MVCLAPRALRDCAPSALSGVVVRPLNFTVRWPLQRRHYYAAAILATLFAMFFVAARFPASETARAVCGIPGLIGLPILFYLWCKSDASHRGVSPPPGALPLGAVLWPVAWVYYVLFTYSFGRAVGRIVLVLVATTAVVAAGALLGHFAGSTAT